MHSSRISRTSPHFSFRSGIATFCYLALLLFGAFPAIAERELHVVGVYEGTNGTTHGAVFVNRPGQSVTLFLGAYDRMDWQITLGVGTTIERVFLNSYYPQTVQGLPPDVPVIRNSYSESGTYLYFGYTLGSSVMLRAVPAISAMTGQEIMSFQGAYQAPATPFVVDSVQDDPRLSVDYPKPVPLETLPDLEFQIATLSGTDLTLHDYTLAGPVDGGSVIPSGHRMSWDAASQYYYGGDDGVIGYDSQTGSTQHYPLPEYIVREGWQMGTAFDRLRNRPLMVTLSGEGFLYSLSTPTRQWSTVSSMHNRDVDCLEYHDADDSLYAATLTHEDTIGGKVIVLRASDGAFRKEIRLPIFPFDIEPGGHRAELVSVGDYLVLLLEPQNWTYPHSRGLLESRIYLIDPRTDDVWLTYRRGGPPNRSPSVQLISPTPGRIVAPGSTLRLTASASDPDGTIRSVEFRVDGDSAGFGTRGANGWFTLDWTVPLSGDHEIVAVATDNLGAIAYSDPATVRVNRSPTVQLISPTDGSVFTRLSVVPLVTTAQDPDGSIVSVEFRVDGIVVGLGSRTPGTDTFTSSWTARDPGTHTIQARARDNQGATVVSELIDVTVVGEASKAVRLLPAQYRAGKKFRVGILVSPGRTITNYTVFDRPPSGWSVSEISDGGAYDPVAGEVRFGPIEDTGVRLLTYSVRPPSNAKGLQIFSGNIVSDGTSVPIAGKQTIGGSKIQRRQLRLPFVFR